MDKGGQYVDAIGYIRTRCKKHPKGRNGYVHEQVLVMEEHIGQRPLPAGYDVYHINGVRRDNRLENLQLITHAEYRQHHTIDMSDRECTSCGSNQTRKQTTIDRPNWYTSKTTGGLLCFRCYSNKYRQKWRLRKKILNTLPRLV
jgi:hypothetical protein